jgi:hypothetical protein
VADTCMVLSFLGSNVTLALGMLLLPFDFQAVYIQDVLEHIM